MDIEGAGMFHKHMALNSALDTLDLIVYTKTVIILSPVSLNFEKYN